MFSKKIVPLSLYLFCLFFSAIAFSETTQNLTSVDNSSTAYPWVQKPVGWSNKLWGTPPESPQVYLGMWTYHVTDFFNSKVKREHSIMENELIAVQYKSLFAGTFMNSYYQRTFMLGLQRNFMEKSFDNNNGHYNFGYRLGLLYGYGSNSQKVIGINTPIIPFPEVFTEVDWHHVGVEIAWTAGILVSARFYVRF